MSIDITSPRQTSPLEAARLPEAPTQIATDLRPSLPPGVDLERETVITGRVVDDAGHTIGGASVHLLDAAEEFTAELFATPAGDFRFFAAPGTWTVRALSGAGNGAVTVAPTGAGIHQIDIKVA